MTKKLKAVKFNLRVAQKIGLICSFTDAATSAHRSLRPLTYTCAEACALRCGYYNRSLLSASRFQFTPKENI